MLGNSRETAGLFLLMLAMGCADSDQCSIKTGIGGVKRDENCEWLQAGECPESPYDDQPCAGDPPPFAFGVHFLETIQCGSRTCASYGSSFGRIPCPAGAADTACFGPTETIPCGYTLCPEPPTCAWEVYSAAGESGCPGQDWTFAFDHGKQPPVPTCDGSPPATAFGVQYSATEYNAESHPCGRYGQSGPCEYLACLDFDSCEWLLSEVKANHLGDRTKCAGWGQEGEPVKQ